MGGLPPQLLAVAVSYPGRAIRPSGRGGRKPALFLIVIVITVTLQRSGKVTKCPMPRAIAHHKDGRSYTVPCMKTTCPHCSKILKNQLLDHARKGFNELYKSDHNTYFLTLTLGNYEGRRDIRVNGKKRRIPYKACNKDMGLYFARFRAYLAKPRYWNGEKVSFRKMKYWRVPELQERGAVHLHVVIDQYIPYDIVHDAWEWATFETSTMIKIKSTTDSVRNVAGYLSKYMTKNMEDRKKLKAEGFRRFSMSTNWRELYTPNYKEIMYNFKLLPKPESPWTFTYDAPLDPYKMGLLAGGPMDHGAKGVLGACAQDGPQRSFQRPGA